MHASSDNAAVRRRGRRQQGLALSVTMLMMVVFTTMLLGFWFVASEQQKTTAANREHGKTFYAAQAGLEKMSADLAALFTTHTAPTPAEVNAVASTANAPAIDGISYSGYQIQYQTNSDGSLASKSQVIGGSGPLNGLQGIVTPFTLKVVADSVDGSESSVNRQIQEVAIPVFEFGIFSENDLSFFAGPNFNFGGRVHTNGNLYLAEGSGATLTLADVVTAAGDVIRTQLSNGWPTSSNYTGTVDGMVTAGNYRALGMSEGSLTGGPGSGANPNWPNLSLTSYNGNIRSGSTGAQKLNLALALAGATPIDMIHRPPAGESPTSAIGEERFYNQASLRILLSDSPSDLPSGAIPLDSTLYSHLTGVSVDACHPPVANTKANGSGSTRLGGYIEIGMQNAVGAWQDVTAEILSQGFEYAPSCTTGGKTYNPILHLERLNPALSSSPGFGSQTASDYVPINMYDAREGELRDVRQSNVALNGVMNIVELDVANLQKWFAGQIGSSGTQALNNSGYIVYFSDRRGNHDAGGNETGEYGYEDNINPGDSSGQPNGVLDPAEDVNGNGVLDVYGGTPSPASGTVNVYGSVQPFTRVTASTAEQSPVPFFRRALRLVDGGLGKLPPQLTASCGSATGGGFTVASENPVYVQGDYNATSAGGASNAFNDAAGACHVPAAVIADAVSLLSNHWLTDTDAAMAANSASNGDNRSFTYADTPGNRNAASTAYRMGVIAGKNLSFPRPSWGAQDFGTDGGAHNFLRYLESWSGQTLSYRGALISMFTSRQATGIYKCCTVVYGAPTRGYNFDTDFEDISKLPPGTPRFTDVNALSYQQNYLADQ